MAESGQRIEAANSGRFSFSLRALLFFVLVSGLAFSHLVSSWRLRTTVAELEEKSERLAAAEQENTELHAQLGHLKIEDPTKPYAVASPFVDPNDERWRWEIYLPQNGYRLYATANAVNGELPNPRAKHVQSMSLPQRLSSLDAVLHRNDSGPWTIHIKRLPSKSTLGGTMLLSDGSWSDVLRLELSAEQSEWIERGGVVAIENAWKSSPSAGDEPMVLLQGGHEVVILEEQGHNSGPWQGLKVWIEKD